MKIRQHLSVLALTGLGICTATVATHAQSNTPGQADFDRCNREAGLAVKAPSASPDTSGRGSSGPLMGKPAPGTTEPGTGSGGTRSGSSTTTGPLLGRPAPDGAPPVTPGNTREGAGSQTKVAESGLNGMATAGANDPAYQQAYRECLKRPAY
jgi:hypothetical protein